MPNRTERHGPTAPIKYGAVSWWLTVVCVILLAVIAAAGSVLSLLYRADAHVALGNAKTVRMALYAASIEAYGENRPFTTLSLRGRRHTTTPRKLNTHAPNANRNSHNTA